MLSICKNSIPIKSINKTNRNYRKYISMEQKLRPRKKSQFPELQFDIHGPKMSQSLSHTHQGIHFQSDGHRNKHIHVHCCNHY